MMVRQCNGDVTMRISFKSLLSCSPPRPQLYAPGCDGYDSEKWNVPSYQVFRKFWSEIHAMRRVDLWSEIQEYFSHVRIWSEIHVSMV
jgi:hypothetical protein